METYEVIIGSIGVPAMIKAIFHNAFIGWEWYDQLFLLGGMAFVILGILIVLLRNRTGLQADKIFAFYNTRKSLNRLYGGIDEELTKAERVYAAWHGATEAVCKSEQCLKKVERLLLVSPEATEILSIYADAGVIPVKISEIQSGILKATEIFRLAGTKVRWFSGQFNLLTIVDPHLSERARVRVEIWLYNGTDKRQNYIINRKSNEVAYNNITDTFEKMWNDAKRAYDPPQDLSTLRQKLGLGIPNALPKLNRRVKQNERG